MKAGQEGFTPEGLASKGLLEGGSSPCLILRDAGLEREEDARVRKHSRFKKPESYWKQQNVKKKKEYYWKKCLISKINEKNRDFRDWSLELANFINLKNKKNDP